jgi:hypothetical protein
MSQEIEIKTDKDYLVFCNDMLEKYNIYKTQNEKLQQIILKLKKTIAKLEKKIKKTNENNINTNLEWKEKLLNDREKILNDKDQLLEEMNKMIHQRLSKVTSSENRLKIRPLNRKFQAKSLKDIASKNRRMRLINYSIRSRIAKFNTTLTMY